ncbi:cellulose binding domain-containing protein [Synechococcus sp. PCC 6312]|uniref:cellulose binding domain-containing protein n=1 Tax=Synechococcus sp. (strain ATCC 27167 / PCC 6312) TaxID=195253 RepID=UPI00029EDC86|nr:cellulose binding domain-containing protein [Synechococcus sp. PCC 6312]AFY61162.1 putative cellulose binding protein,putative calcium-binding protein [Synechococcus sp. PCC 6312]
MAEFAPYVDIALWPTPNLGDIARQTGVKSFNLAFITAEDGNLARGAWGGYGAYSVNQSFFKSQINALRAIGGDVILSFGGAFGRELAEVAKTVTEAKNAYRQVIDAYGVTRLDFDIEGAAVADPVSIARRSQALAELQKEYAAKGINLDIRLTLPVLPSGLTPDGLNVVRSALQAGVNLNLINIMAMNFGANEAPPSQGTMGDYTIKAARSTQAQVKSLYASVGISLTNAQAWGKIGLTPMIGRNDIATEVFTQADALKVFNFAESVGIGMMSMWSIGRDQAPANGNFNSPATYNHSSINQTPWEFAKLFAPYDGVPGTGTPWQPPTDPIDPITPPPINPNPAKANVNFTGTGWGTGFTAEVTLMNSGVAGTGWEFVFRTYHRITSLWNGKYTETTLTGGLYEYRVTHESWNGQLAANSKVSFGFGATAASHDPVQVVQNNDFQLISLKVGATVLIGPGSSPLTLMGTSGNDTLIGGPGNNYLDGRVGADRLIGGLGDDTYVVDNVGDVVVEAVNAGVDTVRGTISYSLSANVENLILTGSANINGTGNSLANTITGNVGNNTLNGGLSADRLIGGAGNDTLIGGPGNDLLMGGPGHDYFRFNSRTEGMDTISDFSKGMGNTDKIQVLASGFGGGLGAGILPSNRFVLGTVATSTAQRFIYNQSTGALFFDPDGLGGTAATQIATLTNKLSLTASDIIVI